MLAILSTTLEKAEWLSDTLQRYWGTHGVYQTIAQYETDGELLSAMAAHKYTSIILDKISNALEIVPQLRALNPSCRIAVITKNDDTALDNQFAIRCYDLGVELMLTQAALDRPWELISKGLCIL